MRPVRPWLRPRSSALAWSVAVMLLVGLAPQGVAADVDHLVVSEVVTGGTSASDELIELYNPMATALPLEGLEVIYVTASGATVSRRAAWALGAPTVPPGGHVLIGNEAGIYASIADATYASGMAATGGSVALRIQGAATAIDAVGWGSAASAWLEGTPAVSPAAGESLERLPGGSLGSGVDSDDNASDFVIRPTPEPQNLESDPVPGTGPTPAPSGSGAPSATPAPSSDAPTASPTPVPSPTAAPTATPEPTAVPAPTVSVATARLLPDGASATVHVTALTAWDFADGGGFAADGSAGIALLGEIPFARGDGLLVSGTLDDRFSQRTLRVTALEDALPRPLAGPVDSLTGAIGEGAEGSLVRVAATVDGSPTALSGGVAFDVDDGSGVTRVVVGTASGIDTAAWRDGTQLTLIGVVGQRDSSGSGTSGYRVQPRDVADVVSVVQPSGPTPTPQATGSAQASATPSAPAAGVQTIAEARAADKNARLTVRGVVTLPSGVVDAESAVVQDATGAILVRLGDEAGDLRLGELVELHGTRSTKSGMESLRVTSEPRRLGSAPQPPVLDLRTGDAREALEARLVRVRGALTAAARRASAGSVSFTIDDGSGELRVAVGANLDLDDAALERGAWVEVTGVLGQETSGSQPTRGYRVWPRGADEVRVVAPVATGAGDDDGAGSSASGGAAGGGEAGLETLGAVDRAELGSLRVGATLVLGPWEEADLGGLLWDGRSLVGISSRSAQRLADAGLAARAPVAVELGHLASVGPARGLGIPVVLLGPDADDLVAGTEPVRRPAVRLPGRRSPAAWVSVVGRVAGDRLTMDGSSVRLRSLCDEGRVPSGVVEVTGVGLPGAREIVVPCGGARPAPALGLTGRAHDAAPPAVGARTVAAESPGPGADPSRRLIAAGLLALGVLGLVAATALRRYGGAVPPEEADEGDVPAADEGVASPRLALVPAPREHGP